MPGALGEQGDVILRRRVDGESGVPAWRLYNPFKAVVCRCYVDALPPSGPWILIVWEDDSVLLYEEIDDLATVDRRSTELYDHYRAGGWTDVLPRDPGQAN